LEKRKKSSCELKELGNVEFRSGNFARSAELYTSAILEYDEDQVKESKMILILLYLDTSRIILVVICKITLIINPNGTT
jgi:hypothetical protein